MTEAEAAHRSRLLNLQTRPLEKLRERITGKVSPEALLAILQDETNGRLADIADILVHLDRRYVDLDTKLANLSRLVAPPLHRFPFERRLRKLRVLARESGTVWELEIPPQKVGIITEIANTWFPYTHLIFTVDGGREEKVEHTKGYLDGLNLRPQTFSPGLPAFSYIKWVAHNNDTSVAAHTFEVYIDGYFIEEKVFRDVTGLTENPSI